MDPHVCDQLVLGIERFEPPTAALQQMLLYIINKGAIGKKLLMDTVAMYRPQAGELLAALPVLLVTRLHMLHQGLSVTHLPEHKQHQFSNF